MNELTKINHNNNFDLIRLFAAFQVVLVHGLEHLTPGAISNYNIHYYLGMIPGVPIFFFVSGYLVSASFLRLNSYQEFFIRRSLRIFPALWVCFVASFLLVLFSGYLSDKVFPLGEFFNWMIAQVSIAQFYNPQFLRGFGVGVLNGSLWTISVELQFYILTPILLFIFRKSKLTYLILFFLALVSNYTILGLVNPNDSLLYKLIEVSFLPWIVYFIIGQLSYIYWKSISKFFVGKFNLWIFFYIFICFIYINFPNKNDIIVLGNKLPPHILLFLFGVILSVSYSKTYLSKKLLNGNDISYGLYLYHMPIINCIIYVGFFNGNLMLLLMSILTALAAALSWFLVEKPSLKLKY